MKDPNELLDIGAAARLLHVSETSLRRWTNSGRLPCLRIGRRRERRFRRGDLLAFLENQPSDIAPSVNSDGRTAKKSDRFEQQATFTLGSHLCAFYSTDLGRLSLFVPYILDGLNEGSVCFLLAAPDVREAIVASLTKKRPSIQADIDARRLVLSRYRADPDAQLKYWRELIDKCVDEGAESFRIAGDVWNMRSQVSEEKFHQYEAAYDHAISHQYPVVTLCVYDVREFSGVEVLAALKGHRDNLRYPLHRAFA